MVRTQISLTEEQYVAVKRLAAERGMSLSAVIRDAVDRCVAMSSRSPWETMMSAAGSVSSGLGDVSVNHDDYLYGPLQDPLP